MLYLWLDLSDCVPLQRGVGDVGLLAALWPPLALVGENVCARVPPSANCEVARLYQRHYSDYGLRLPVKVESVVQPKEWRELCMCAFGNSGRVLYAREDSRSY